MQWMKITFSKQERQLGRHGHLMNEFSAAHVATGGPRDMVLLAVPGAHEYYGRPGPMGEGLDVLEQYGGTACPDLPKAQLHFIAGDQRTAEALGIFG